MYKDIIKYIISNNGMDRGRDYDNILFKFDYLFDKLERKSYLTNEDRELLIDAICILKEAY